jgi:DNA-binding IclR family transcriptional regulator
VTSLLCELFGERSDCLRVLRCFAEEERLTPPELSARTGMSIPAVCRCLGFLESRSLVGPVNDLLL